METETQKFKNLLALLVLVSGPEIMGRAPSYLTEKFRQYTGLPVNAITETDDQSGWLDMHNKAIYDAYLSYWKVG